MMAKEPVKSALRAIEVLKAFAKIREPLSQAILIEETGYPQSSMTALLKTLTASGVLHYNSRSRQYYPTMVVKDLGSWIEDLTPESGWITTIMQGLRNFSGETVALGAQNDTSLMYLRSFESEHIIRYNVRPGEQRPLLETSMGWLLLSRQPAAQVERVYRKTPLAMRQVAGSLGHVQAEMERLRNADHCYLPNVPPRAGTVSMLIPAAFNRAPLVVGVGGFIDRMEPRADAILGKMRALIRRESEALADTAL